MTKTRLKTTTDRFLRGGWRPRCGAAIALMLLGAACSAEATPSTTPVPTTQVTSTVAASPETESGTSLLRAALDRFESGYSFVSEASVGEEQAIRVEGRHVAGSSHQLITSGDGTIEYLVVGGDQWARTPDEAWEVISDEGAPSAPLERLAAPTSVTVTDATATRTEMDATYPAERFGLTGDDLVVHIVIRDLLLSSAGYVTSDGGVVATVDTRFEALADTTPITAPP